MTIVQDSREQTPLKWPEGVAVEVDALQSGDYTARGLESVARIERKELGDLCACCCSSGRERFNRELERLQAFQLRAVVIESSLADAMAGRYRSKLHPNSLLASVCAWQARYGVPFLWCGDPAGAARITLELLKQCHRQMLEQYKALVG